MTLNRSIALRAAVLMSATTFVTLLAIGIALSTLGRDGQPPADPANTLITAIADAVTRAPGGHLTIAKTAALDEIRQNYPSVWYEVSDGDEIVSGGAAAARSIADVHGAKEPANMLALDMAIGKRWPDGFEATRDTAVGPVSITVGGLPLGRLPFVSEALAFSALFSVPLLVILTAAAIAAIAIVPRLIARPVRLVAGAAEAIDGVPNGRRLPDEDTPRELAPLVSAFNRALERIDLAAEAQASFLANAAHELRTPLAVLRSHLDDIPHGSARMRLIGDVHRMSEIVTMLLQMARLTGEPLKPEQIDLVSLCRSVVAEEVPAALDEGEEIEFFAARPSLMINGSPAAIRTAVVNLLRNAVRHARSTAPITVEVLSPACVRVVDHGRGIDPAMREEIVKPFVRDNTHREGVGLGLAIVAQVMALHDGTLEIGETPGGGATFQLVFRPLPMVGRLPLTENQPLPSKAVM
ncbi:MAG TPA: HAMP domain-containing sensor histidine kinase [Rhizobium sp.]|nr:HAMP domain-containing sensor histidine kinase [Rhizobium sp.]